MSQKEKEPEVLLVALNAPKGRKDWDSLVADLKARPDPEHLPGPVPDADGWARAWAEHVAVCEELKETRKRNHYLGTELDRLNQACDLFEKNSAGAAELERDNREFTAEVARLEAERDAALKHAHDPLVCQSMDSMDARMLAADAAALRAALRGIEPLLALLCPGVELEEPLFGPIRDLLAAPHPGAEMLADVAEAKEDLEIWQRDRVGSGLDRHPDTDRIIAALAKWVQP